MSGASYTRESITDPVPLSPRMQDLVATVAADQGLKILWLPSGAGHDAQNVTRSTPTDLLSIGDGAGVRGDPGERSFDRPSVCPCPPPRERLSG